MYLDLHSHSVSSDDSRATVEQYLKWIQVLRRRGFTVDGIVLTEHRKFDFHLDYSTLAQQYGVLVMKGSELDSNTGSPSTVTRSRGCLPSTSTASLTLVLGTRFTGSIASFGAFRRH